MKILLFVSIAIALVLTVECSPKPKVYPNIVTGQLVSEIKWGMNYSSVKNILMEKYKLGYPKEIGLNDKNRTKRVYEFDGGKYNNIETRGWVVIFVNDSLHFITIVIAKKNPKENEKIFNKLSAINNNELAADTTKFLNENKWYLKRDGKNISEVMIAMMPHNKGIDVLFSKPSLK